MSHTRQLSSRRRRLVIIGAGGHGQVVADTAECTGQWDEIVFLDDGFPSIKDADGWPVLGQATHPWAVDSLAETELIVGIGNGSVRIAVLEVLRQAGLSIATVVHPAASISKRATLGPGSVVMAGACINVGAVIARGAIINTSASVDHHCQLAEGVHICPGTHLAGNVKVGRLSWIGIGASVRQGISIGERVTIGAGASVVCDIEAGTTAIGVPAKPMRNS